MIVNIPRVFGGTLANPSQTYIPLSSEWLALDGVEITDPSYEKYFGDLVFVSKTKESPDEFDLIVLPNTGDQASYRFKLAFYRDAGDAEIVGFVCGFYHPFGSGVAKHPIVGRLP